jgi:hypothetical protein
MYNNGGNSWADYMNNRQSSPYINMLEGYARNYMDPNSPYNMKQFAGLRGEGRSAAGQQFNQGMKMSAAGQNPFANQQYQGAMRSNVDSAMMARNQQTNTNQQLGQGMLGMGMQARATQAGMSQQQQQWDREYKQHETGQWLALGGTLLGAGISGPLASMLQKPPEINTRVDAGPSSPSFLNSASSGATVPETFAETNPGMTPVKLAGVESWVSKNIANPMNPTDAEKKAFQYNNMMPWESYTGALNGLLNTSSPYYSAPKFGGVVPQDPKRLLAYEKLYENYKASGKTWEEWKTGINLTELMWQELENIHQYYLGGGK